MTPIVIAAIVLYCLGIAITHFTLYILACREYKRKHEILNFDRWYDDNHGEDSVYAGVWPVFLVAAAISGVLDALEKRIRRKFNIR